ncbi:thiamine biosynthesis protein ThiS [Candidatus Woesearchaeota archaeon]|nr:MAG: thiamine biosynthesis protein ThiS [Candidatus Woesearchaeota archaeon]
MKLFIERENKHNEMDFKGSVKELLQKLEINPETVLVVKNDALVQEDEALQNTDVVKLISVISGG